MKYIHKKDVNLLHIKIQNIESNNSNLKQNNEILLKTLVICEKEIDKLAYINNGLTTKIVKKYTIEIFNITKQFFEKEMKKKCNKQQELAIENSNLRQEFAIENLNLRQELVNKIFRN